VRIASGSTRDTICKVAIETSKRVAGKLYVAQGDGPSGNEIGETVQTTETCAGFCVIKYHPTYFSVVRMAVYPDRLCTITPGFYRSIGAK
jgi:hypothetical protein